MFSCQEFEAEVPDYSDFGIYQVVTDPETGKLLKGDPISMDNVPAGTEVHVEVLTKANIASIWPGDFTYRPWGDTDSVLDSRNYEHYGQLGAEGLSMTQIEGGGGYFRRYTWPESGSFDVAVVLTNHGINSPEYKQEVYDFSVQVTP